MTLLDPRDTYVYLLVLAVRILAYGLVSVHLDTQIKHKSGPIVCGTCVGSKLCLAVIQKKIRGTVECRVGSEAAYCSIRSTYTCTLFGNFTLTISKRYLIDKHVYCCNTCKCVGKVQCSPRANVAFDTIRLRSRVKLCCDENIGNSLLNNARTQYTNLLISVFNAGIDKHYCDRNMRVKHCRLSPVSVFYSIRYGSPLFENICVSYSL